MKGTYKGKYTVKNPAKYAGNPRNVVYRSSWEKCAFKWCESNPNVVAWNSEEIVVPYISEIDNRPHRYYIDLQLKMKSGKVYLIEIKPSNQTKPPRKRKKTKKYLTEVKTYVTNTCKWKAANQFAKDRGWYFEIWTEHTLKGMGIKII
jgi:hypothetical protein